MLSQRNSDGILAKKSGHTHPVIDHYVKLKWYNNKL